MEEILQTINSNFISLPPQEVRNNNVILGEVLGKLLEIMEGNNLFRELFRAIYYGGSYYDGLKVGSPEEYDLDILFSLPLVTAPRVTNSDTPGFVHVRLEAMNIFNKQLSEFQRYPGLQKCLLDEDDYLATSKVSAWMESVIRAALNQFPCGCQISTSFGVFNVKTHKGGPAFTLKLNGCINGKQMKMDIDLVPCFVFGQNNWPRPPYRINPVSSRPEFFVVPKKPFTGREYISRYWRLSFQEQESQLIRGLENFKPALRLLKKLRDTDRQVFVASYYIKTIFLWELENDRTLWNRPLSYVFMTMLRRYQQRMEEGVIPYYWNEHNNLVERAHRDTLTNAANRLNYIIARIERNPEEIPQFLLTAEERVQFESRRNESRRNNLVPAFEELHIEPEAVAIRPGTRSDDSSWCSVM